MLKIIITDDLEDIHKSLRATLDAVGINYVITQDFYNTDNLVDYLYDVNPCEDDLLILDQNYGGVGFTGLESLGDIREYAPDISIILLTTDDNDIEKYNNAQHKFSLTYINKPIDADGLRNVLLKLFDIERLY